MSINHPAMLSMFAFIPPCCLSMAPQSCQCGLVNPELSWTCPHLAMSRLFKTFRQILTHLYVVSDKHNPTMASDQQLGSFWLVLKLPVLLFALLYSVHSVLPDFYRLSRIVLCKGVVSFKGQLSSNDTKSHQNDSSSCTTFIVCVFNQSHYGQILMQGNTTQVWGSKHCEYIIRMLHSHLQVYLYICWLPDL